MSVPTLFPYVTIIDTAEVTNTTTPSLNYTNPLDLPEIIALVGYFLTLWFDDVDYQGGIYLVFEPQQLHSCALVNKTWYRALLPVLWRTYDGRIMYDIPNDIISRYSHLFRQVYSCIDHPGPFNCIRLLTLEMNLQDTNNGHPRPSDLVVQKQILHNNPNLKMLTWIGRFYNSTLLGARNSPLLDPSDLFGLVSIENLCLAGWDVSINLFRALMAVSGHLTSLQLIMLTRPRPGDPSPIRRNEIDGKRSSAAGEQLVFPCLKSVDVRFSSELTDDARWKLGQELFFGIQELEDLLSNCPQLETLAMDVPRRADLSGLAVILRDRSPLIRDAVIWGDDQGGERQLAHLIGHAFRKGLVKLKVDAAELGIELATAMMVHASTLKHLQVTTLGHMEDDGVLELLVRGLNLKVILLQCQRPTGGQNTVAVLSSRIWGCKDIEMLDLGFEITFMDKDILRVLEEMAETEPAMKKWEYAQYATRYKIHPQVLGSPDLLRGYFGLIRGMSKLHSVYFGNIHFRRR